MKNLIQVLCVLYMPTAFSLSPVAQRRLNGMSIQADANVVDECGVGVARGLRQADILTAMRGLRVHGRNHLEMRLYFKSDDQTKVWKLRASQSQLQTIANSYRNVDRVERDLLDVQSALQCLSQRYSTFCLSGMPELAHDSENLTAEIQRFRGHFERQYTNLVKLSFLHSYDVLQNRAQDFSSRKDRSSWESVLHYQLLRSHMKNFFSMLEESSDEAYDDQNDAFFELSPEAVEQTLRIFSQSAFQTEESSEQEEVDQWFADDTQQRFEAPPAYPNRVADLPASSYRAGSDECVICQSYDMVELACGHSLHADCLGSHVLHQDHCPVCRESIPTKIEDRNHTVSRSAN